MSGEGLDFTPDAIKNSAMRDSEKEYRPGTVSDEYKQKKDVVRMLWKVPGQGLVEHQIDLSGIPSEHHAKHLAFEKFIATVVWYEGSPYYEWINECDGGHGSPIIRIGLASPIPREYALPPEFEGLTIEFYPGFGEVELLGEVEEMPMLESDE